MSDLYECLRCKYTTPRKINMKKHLEKNTKCPKSIDSIGYTDDQLYNLSLVKIEDRNKDKKDKNKYKKKNKNDTENMENIENIEIINEIKNIEIIENNKIANNDIEEKKDKLKCTYCNHLYVNQYSLRRHLNSFCKIKNKPINTSIIEHQTIENKTIENNIENNIEKNIENNIENQTIENNIDKNIENNIETQNNYISNNQTNNLNINIISLPVGFEKDWNTEHINKYLKELIVVSDNKYTSLLTKILDNKTNLNVILDKELDNGYIFSDNEYKNIEKQEIVDKSMEKLNKELNRMLGEILDSDEIFCMKSIESQKTLINDKYSEYTKNSSIQKIVQKYIIDIYDATKNVANDYLIEYKKINKEGF